MVVRIVLPSTIDNRFLEAKTEAWCHTERLGFESVKGVRKEFDSMEG